MATYRVHKTQNYTIMSNTHLQDEALSLKAKGLLSVMLSLPENWDYTIAGLVAISKENDTAVKSTLDELKKGGYLVVTKLTPAQTDSGRFEYLYDIYEQPQQKEPAEKQAVEKQGVEVLGVENQGQLNTNISNTNKLNTNNKKKESKNSFDAIIDGYIAPDGQSVRFEDADKRRELLQEWLKVRKAKRAAMTDRAIQMNIDKLDKLARESSMSVVEYLSEVICRGWAAFYIINNYSKPQSKGKNGIAVNSRPSDLDGVF